jgi:hypothetical protein
MHGSFDQHHLGKIARDAIVAIARARRDVAFRFVGPVTPALERCLRLARREFPHIHTELTGFIPYDRVPAQLAESWIGITPYEPSTGTHCAFVAKPSVSRAWVAGRQLPARQRGAVFRRPRRDSIQFDRSGFATAALDWIRALQPERAGSGGGASKGRNGAGLGRGLRPRGVVHRNRHQHSNNGRARSTAVEPPTPVRMASEGLRVADSVTRRIRAEQQLPPLLQARPG